MTEIDPGGKKVPVLYYGGTLKAIADSDLEEEAKMRMLATTHDPETLVEWEEPKSKKVD